VKFLLNVYTDGVVRAASSGAERDIMREHADFRVWVHDSGELIDGQLVADPSTSSVVRVRDGVVAVAGGLVLESPIQLVAYYLVDCDDRERAVELAAMIPAARYDTVEVRPVMLPTGMEET
jgi:hypothetical protein